MTHNLPSLRHIALALLKFSGIGFVYVLSDLSVGLGAVGKVGVKGDADSDRLDCIQRSIRDLKGKDIRIRQILAMPTFAPRPVEQLIHRIHAGFRTAKYHGSSGGTEWFLHPNFLCGFWMLLLGMHFDASLGLMLPAVLFTIFNPLPLDLCVAVVLFSLIQFAVAAGFFWLVVSFLNFVL